MKKDDEYLMNKLTKGPLTPQESRWLAENLSSVERQKEMMEKHPEIGNSAWVITAGIVVGWVVTALIQSLFV